jgi:hypothetical protein
MSDQAFVEMIQQAVGDTTAPKPQPPRKGDDVLAAALAKSYKLRRGESRLLSWLLIYGFGSKDELRNAMGLNAQTYGSMQSTIGVLRGKLAPHDIIIINIVGKGYRMIRLHRTQILERLAGQGLIPDHLWPKSQGADQQPNTADE